MGINIGICPEKTWKFVIYSTLFEQNFQLYSMHDLWLRLHNQNKIAFQSFQRYRRYSIGSPEFLKKISITSIKFESIPKQKDSNWKKW
jgi:hypothetical protein